MHIYSLLQFNHLMSFIIIFCNKDIFLHGWSLFIFLSITSTVESFLFIGDYQNFAGSRRCDFLGNWFVAFQCKTIHDFVKCLWGHKFVGKCNPQNPRTLCPPPPPTNKDDSTVFHLWKSVEERVLDV